jgi:hypothetical protein
VTASQASPGPRRAAPGLAGVALGGSGSEASRSCPNGAEGIAQCSDHATASGVAGDADAPRFGSHRARRASEIHTRYPYWVDDKGRSQPASEHYLYNTWNKARARCHRPRDEHYDYYGGRGIQMYPEWRVNPVAFYNWIQANLGPRPDGTTLDRIDNDGHYEPGNLQWAPASVQANNRRPRCDEREPERCPCIYVGLCSPEAGCRIDDAMS